MSQVANVGTKKNITHHNSTDVNDSEYQLNCNDGNCGTSVKTVKNNNLNSFIKTKPKQLQYQQGDFVLLYDEFDQQKKNKAEGNLKRK